MLLTLGNNDTRATTVQEHTMIVYKLSLTQGMEEVQTG